MAALLRIVSTYNPADWDTYVKRNIESWRKHLDAEIVVYHEDDAPEMVGIEWRQWEDIPGAVEFIGQALEFPPACGRFGARYDYNYDAAKFSRKVFAQLDAAEESGDYLIWLDADVEVHRDIDEPLIQELLGGLAMARYERPGYHTETGVVIYDLRQCWAFFEAWQTLYENRRVYCLPKGWHDCWTLDFVVSQLGMATSNLTRGGRDYSTGQALDVVPDSVLGAYLRHDKGMRKYA